MDLKSLSLSVSAANSFKRFWSSKRKSLPPQPADYLMPYTLRVNRIDDLTVELDFTARDDLLGMLYVSGCMRLCFDRTMIQVLYGLAKAPAL